MRTLSGSLLILGIVAGVAASAPAAPFAYPVALANGRQIGHLFLGDTTLQEAVRLFPAGPAGYEGAPRPARGFPLVRVGQVSPEPTVVFNPWMSLYVLYFDGHQRLVIIADGGPSTLRTAGRAYLLTRYPQLREMERVGEMVEFQGAIAPCVALLALVHSRTGAVGDVAYAFTCPTARLSASP